MWRRFSATVGAFIVLGLAGTAAAAAALAVVAGATRRSAGAAGLNVFAAFPAFDLSAITSARLGLPLARVEAPNLDLVYGIGAAVAVLSLLTLWLIRARLVRSPGWSLGDALSEEVDLTNDQGVPIRVLRASSSRLIAFAGLMVMLFMYFGFGLFLLYYFGTGQKVPTTLVDNLQKFMLAGVAMFTPYAVNQVRAAVNTARMVVSPQSSHSPTPSPATATAATAGTAPAAGAAPAKALAGPAPVPALPPASAPTAYEGGC